MRLMIEIARHILIPATIWIGLIACANFYQMQRDAPETGYIVFTVFVSYWMVRSLTLCFLWPLASGFYYAAGQLTALAIQQWWPTIFLHGGVTLRLEGPYFGIPPVSPFARFVINGVIIANYFLPVILTVSAILLSIGSVVALKRRHAHLSKPFESKPLATVEPTSPKNAVARPIIRKSGYNHSNEAFH